MTRGYSRRQVGPYLAPAQGSGDWLKLRLGIPTASDFEKIVTPTGKLSAQARKYAYCLVAETIMQASLDSVEGVDWMTRGKELEPEAVRLYEFEAEIETRKVGFITTDDGLIGCSPDRLVGEVGLLEVKCPVLNTHVGYLLGCFGNDYIPQAQGRLMVAEREWCDKFSYHPELHRCRSEPTAMNRSSTSRNRASTPSMR